MASMVFAGGDLRIARPSVGGRSTLTMEEIVQLRRDQDAARSAEYYAKLKPPRSSAGTSSGRGMGTGSSKK